MKMPVLLDPFLMAWLEQHDIFPCLGGLFCPRAGAHFELPPALQDPTLAEAAWGPPTPGWEL